MEKTYTAREAKDYFNSVPDELLDRTIVEDHPLYDIIGEIKSKTRRIDPEEYRRIKIMAQRLINDELQEEVDKKESSMPCNGLNPPTPYFYCDTLKKLVLSTLKHKGWTINDVKFSDKGNVESINIKFSSQFTLGGTNNPWDPR